MKLFLSASSSAYSHVRPVEAKLLRLGHEIIRPNGFDDDPSTYPLEADTPEFRRWANAMWRRDMQLVGEADATLVLNYPKMGIDHYIGDAVFLEMAETARIGNLLYLQFGVPRERMDVLAFQPVLLYGDLSAIPQKRI